MVGEVWFCSGQSNMEMPVAGWGKVMNYEREITEANYPSIRLFQVKKNTSVTPLSDMESTMGGWQECSSATIPEFSSLAYFYARSLWKELNVPVGVIDCTWGGTPAEAWTSYETLKQVLGFREELAKMEQLDFDPIRMEKAIIKSALSGNLFFLRKIREWRKISLAGLHRTCQKDNGGICAFLITGKRMD